MTMFRRVFSNHFEEQDNGPAPVNRVEPKQDIPPAPPSLPPQVKLPEKSQMTELEQLKPKGTPVSLEMDEEPAAPDETTAARAAEVHAQMVLRDQAKPAGSPNGTIDPVAPQPAATELPPAARRSGRARTRLLGFDAGTDVTSDPIAQAQIEAGSPPDARINPVGWAVVTKGPGAGQFFALFAGVAMVGRGEDQGIRLDFGDQAISRQNHAALAYDPEDNKFYLGHGGKSNIIKLNGRPVLSTEEVCHGDSVRIGETTLRLVALCGEDFKWSDVGDE